MMRGVATMICGMLLAGPAAAHAVLIDSMPAPLGHVAAGKLDVMLRYNSRIDAGRSKLLLKQGDASRRLTAQPAPTPDVLRTGLQLEPGQYEIDWQVLATDGHITRGRIPFTVDAAAGSPAAPGPSAAQ